MFTFGQKIQTEHYGSKQLIIFINRDGNINLN